MCGYPTTASGGIASCPEWQRRSVFLNGAHLHASFPPLSASQWGCLGLTSGRLCWRPALRRPASMSEPRSSRPPWALLSYYSHSSGCCRGFQTSKRTFTLPLSLCLLSHSLSPRLPPFSLWLPSSCVCLIALSEEQSGVVFFTWRLVAARVSQSKQKMRHVEGKGGAVSIQG